MNSKSTNTDFSTYTFEDFLQNNFFISSIKYPTEETNSFWEQFGQTTPGNIDEFNAAKECLKKMSASRDSLSESEITNLWERLDKTTNNTHRSDRKRYVLAGWSVAASVALLIGCFFFIQDYLKNSIPDITDFAVQTKAELPASDETLLILSEEKSISIAQKESEITYEEQKIKANEESIIKEEVATFNQLIIPRGKRSVLTFSEGTKVWVNAGTRVIYPSEFEKEKREIYVDGEIYLEVARDDKRPFYVRTKDMNVKVLGTKFNVTAYESESVSNVVLVEGSVQVETALNASTVLAPNQMFTSENGRESVEKVNTTFYISWVDGLYHFNSTSLGLVLKRLSLYYGVSLESEASVNYLKCSGKIDLKDNIELILKGLTFMAPITYVYDKENSIYRIMRNSE